jgi:DNA mismatch endonuclease, patch repair protein
VRHGGGRAVASVALRRKADGRRVYAYLRWSVSGRTVERYLGQVERPTRAENLAAGWGLAVRRGLADAPSAGSRDASETDDQPGGRSWASSPAVRAVMRANKGRDTRPELALRSAIHARGLRYRVGQRPVPEIRRTADIVFPRARVAVFVDGCFWHGCPEHHRPAKRNAEFWTGKIAGNIARDADTDERLRRAGWLVVRVWEHEAPAVAADRIQGIVRESARPVSAVSLL